MSAGNPAFDDREERASPRAIKRVSAAQDSSDEKVICRKENSDIMFRRELKHALDDLQRRLNSVQDGLNKARCLVR